MDRPVFTEDEAGLLDYIYVIWKRRWFIIALTLLVVTVVGIISFLMPKKWEIDAMIVPSKFLIQTEQGDFKDVVVIEPKQIASQINQHSYDNLIAAELSLDIKQFPEIKAVNIRDTKLVQISTKANDVDKAKQILHSLFNHIKRDLDKKIDVEIKGLDTQIESKKNVIKSKEIEIENKKNSIKLKELQKNDRKNEIKTRQNRIKDKENVIKTKENTIKLKNNAIKIENLNIKEKEGEKNLVKEEINTLNNKLIISEDREVAIIDEMKGVKDRINKIEEEQKKVLNKKSNKNALSILLYSNEIQNNLRYYNSLDEKLTDEKRVQEDINLAIEQKNVRLELIDNQIERIRTKIEDIKTEIDNINTQIDDTNTQIDDINTQIDDIENEIGKINNEINQINNSITSFNNDIENVRNEISLIEERKGRIDYTQLIKEPTSSIYPVSPKTKLNILMAGILSLFTFSMFVFFLEYIEKK